MPTKSSLPDIHVPDISIWDLLFERTDRTFPNNKVILRDAETKRSYTFGQAKKSAVNFGKTLKSVWQWQKGDVLATFTPNCIDVPSLIWGTHWAGGIVSPVNPAYTTKELAFQLQDSKAKVLVTQLAFLEVALAAAKIAGIPKERIVLVGDAKDETKNIMHFKELWLIQGDSRHKRTPITNPRTDLAFLAYSSGTTGLPKGVMLSHTNIVSNILMIHSVEGPNMTWNGGADKTGDRMLAFLPFYHIYGLVCLMHLAMYSGVELVVMPKFELDKFCSYIQDLKITIAPVVPPVALLLGKHPIVANYDLSSLRMLSSGAAPLTKELVETVWQRIKVPIKQGYGLSETSPATHVQAWDKWHDTIGSAGPLLPNMVAKYMSPEDKEVPAGQTGELWLKGPNIFLGYLNNPAGTKNAITEDGYFKTGDVGHQDENGDFFITDRIKELIKYKGFQVAPAELEGVLLSHQDIDDVAVIGVYDKGQATEVPRAYIVPRGGVEGTDKLGADIIQWLSERVAAHKKLRGGVRFVSEVPKSAAGKILRRVLVDRAKQEDQGVQSKL
ncbi:hypothetical protein B0J13DRAFT_625510 [Dactylonectria estremocensis]|uniref:Uncharacterized protein n=1 Tax=Dactylonectria estremocensis TaxID=1079267 RepID=A0A9P9EFV7_9HYPO|nr:hypothetical protein B0J13DRAFT_625510 [Dactylonectria estremocensis]